MALDPFLTPWSGTAFRHIPAGSSYNVLDFRFAVRAADNRWNYQEEATLYLASDHGVALAEFARHVREDRSPELGRATVGRTVYRLQVVVDFLLDLRDARLCRALSLQNAPACFLDKAVARAVAQYLRRTTSAQALLVPSMAFLDQGERWVMALFLEKLPSDPRQFITSVQVDGSFHISL